MTRAITHIGGPLAALLLLVALFFAYEPLRKPLGNAPPPIETLTVERTVLDENGISLKVRADGTEPVSIAQVQVDGAFWQFAQDPPGALQRLTTAWITIPYPWVEGETHKILLLTRNGLTFEHEIEVAWPTPQVGATELWRLTLGGLFVGLLPVALGMLFYPALRSGGVLAFRFALALTIGLLAFLLIDMLEEALELAVNAAAGLNTGLLVWAVTGLSCLLLFGLVRLGSAPLVGVRLATSIAFAIGLHNLGEGLAIGSAFASGAAALGGYLLLGFTLHNVTEGIGIVAPLLDRRPRLLLLAVLAALAGLPAVFGMWLGAFAFSSHWAALALAVGAGAILQVMIEVGLLLKHDLTDDGHGFPVILAGLSAGVAVMYVTALLVPV